MGPLKGIRVIDMSSVLMGPFASQTLGDMGADVIKVEPPLGDLVRQVAPARNRGMGALFLNANRNKRSLALDLKQRAGVEALKRLLATADVLLYNVRPQAMDRLGLDYESVSGINSRIIYAGMFGFGQTGPYAARPAYDDLIQGAATLPYLIALASDGTPRYVPTAMADRIVGQTAVGAITAALFARERTGRGDRVDIPMFETMVSFVLADHMGGLTYQPATDAGGYPRLLSRERRPYETKDGYICAVIYNDKQWNAFLKATGRESLAIEDHRFANFANRTKNIDHVYGVLSDIFKERSTEAWMKVLEEADLPFMPMHDLQSVHLDPHLKAIDFFRRVEHPSEGTIISMRPPVNFSSNKQVDPRPAPRLGEHTIEVLRESGLTQEHVAELLASGVASCARAE